MSSRFFSVRQRTLGVIVLSCVLLFAMVVGGVFIQIDEIKINLEAKNNPPSLAHLFGTDWLGRDMFTRTVKGLTISLGVGVIAAVCSTFIALCLSGLSLWNRLMDSVVTWLIDLFLSIPHIVMLLLISFAFGGGFKGVVIGLALTHWPSLARLLRAEMMQLERAEFVHVSKRLGKNRLWIARHHVMPHVIPQLITGFVLLFPHAILHEASITFLGFGLSTETPAIGIILSESMRYLSTGHWWLAFFPGLILLIMVGLFDVLGRNIRKMMDPYKEAS